MNELPVTRPPQLFSLCAKDYGTAREQTNQSYKMAKEENLGKRLHRWPCFKFTTLLS